MLTPEKVKLKTNILWKVTELDCKVDNMTLKGNNINLPTSVTIWFKDKFKIRHTVKGEFKIRHTINGEPLLFHIMLKQGMTWFTLASNSPPETA